MAGGISAPNYWTIIPAYQVLCEQMARQVKGRSPMVSGLEIDDLVQEGLIAVWLATEAGFVPSQVVIRNRMVDWVRHMRSTGKEMSYQLADDV